MKATMNHPHDEENWLRYLQLRKNPFPVVPDVDNFFVCDPIDQVLVELEHGINARKGFLIFTGEVGLGKTTICRKLMNVLEDKGVKTSLVFHTFYQENELLREIVRDFGIESDSLVLSDQMKVLSDFLLEQHRQEKNCAIIIDDAQNLDHKSLELIRMISNLETHREKLVQILLIGQPELEETLNASNLRQLRSRIMIHAKAKPLDPKSLHGYVMFKLYMAGNSGQIEVPKDVVHTIWRKTHGNLRQVNKLMERCLQVAFICNTTKISRRVLKKAYRDYSPSKSCWFFNPRLAWVLSTALFLLVAGWVLSEQYRDPLVGSTEQKNYVSVGFFHPGGRIKHGDPNGKRAEEWDGTVPSDSFEAYSQDKDWLIDDAHAVEAFLAEYGLSFFTETFSEALRAGHLEKVQSVVFDATGQQMVVLHTVPEHIRQHYGILGLSRDTDKKKMYLLFWRPPFKVTDFYPKYQGEEIAHLEKLLAQRGLYHHKLDGVVGPKLWAAVKCFQENNRLQVTGFPDNETIFLLCNQDRSIGT
jgi:general secretion pathway protein A